MYTVTLRKPGRPDSVQHMVPHLGARIELPVDRLSVSRGWSDWHDLPIHDTTIFIETYEVKSVDPSGKVLAVFAHMRRSHELSRRFDPARLPA